MRGRPRSETARRNILAAALRVARSRGYASLTMEGIASEAGVGKQTLYRWWSSRAAIVIEALREYANVEIPVPDTGRLEDDLHAFVRSTMHSRQVGIAALLRALMAEAQTDAATAQVLRHELLEPRRAALRTLFVRAHDRGEVTSLTDVELWIDVVFGVMWYRLLADVGSLDDRFAERVSLLLATAAHARHDG